MKGALKGSGAIRWGRVRHLQALHVLQHLVGVLPEALLADGHAHQADALQGLGPHQVVRLVVGHRQDLPQQGHHLDPSLLSERSHPLSPLTGVRRFEGAVTELLQPTVLLTGYNGSLLPCCDDIWALPVYTWDMRRQYQRMLKPTAVRAKPDLQIFQGRKVCAKQTVHAPHFPGFLQQPTVPKLPQSRNKLRV